MKKFLSEFKAFALKGNMFDLAVGVIVGAAFQGVVTSLTDNILSPIIGLFVGQNFDALQAEVLGVTFQYGAFITSLINFIIMALVVFLLMRAVNKMMTVVKTQPAEPEAPTTKQCPFCMSTIPIEATRCLACTSHLEKADSVS